MVQFHTLLLVDTDMDYTRVMAVQLTEGLFYMGVMEVMGVTVATDQ
jgi:hypothetical protein